MLQLKKDIHSLELEVKGLLEKEIAISYKSDETPADLEKFYASKVISLLKETLSKIAADNLAKEAFTKSISTINFNLGDKNNSNLEKEVISITIDTSKGLKSFPKAAALQSLIEKGL
jgi:hypothetical protein